MGSSWSLDSLGSPVAGTTLSLGSLGSQQHWTETEHWQTHSFFQLQAEAHNLPSRDLPDLDWDCLGPAWSGTHRRKMKLRTERTRPRRPKEMILPSGSLGKTDVSDEVL